MMTRSKLSAFLVSLLLSAIQISGLTKVNMQLLSSQSLYVYCLLSIQLSKCNFILLVPEWSFRPHTYFCLFLNSCESSRYIEAGQETKYVKRGFLYFFIWAVNRWRNEALCSFMQGLPSPCLGDAGAEEFKRSPTNTSPWPDWKML